MDKIKIYEEDFNKKYWGLGCLLKKYFFMKNKGTLELEFPDNIEEILLKLIKKQKNTKPFDYKAITYTNIFTMENGHICKNPIIELERKEIIPEFMICKTEYYPFDEDIAFQNSAIVKMRKDTKSAYYDTIKYVFDVKVSLKKDSEHYDSMKNYCFYVYDIIDPSVKEKHMQIHETYVEAFGENDFKHSGYIDFMSCLSQSGNYQLLIERKIKIIDIPKNCNIVTNKDKCYRIWIDNNDIYGIQKIGDAKTVECDSKMTVDEFFEKFPNLKNDWENVI